MGLLGASGDGDPFPDRGDLQYMEPDGAGDHPVLRAACHGL